MKEIGIGLLGLGTIGTGVYQMLTEKRQLLEQRTGVSLVIRRVAEKDAKKRLEVSVPKGQLTTEALEVIRDPQVDLVVELIGGIEPAAGYLLEAIRQKKSVVTANKALLAEKGGEIFREAARAGVAVGFEASVAGGIPILKAIREGFVGNRIQEVYGIINGTSNYILTEMTEKGAPFGEVLAKAQQEGYAERDPRFDVEGTDAAQKLAILVSLCYGMEPSAAGICVEGIEQVTPLDINFAKKFGYVIKLLAIAKQGNPQMGVVSDSQIEARVHPTLIPVGHPLADVGGVFNAIYLKGDAVGETMFFGRGAGRMPTASAVVSDIAMIARARVDESGGSGGGGLFPQPSLRPAVFQPVDDLVSEQYLRFTVVDRPGILAQIAGELGKNGVSISSVSQQGREEGQRVSVVIMTHEAREKDIQKALSTIDRLEGVLDRTVRLRVQRF